MKRVKLFLAALLLSASSLFGVIAPVVVHAAGLNCQWTGSTSDNFNTASNWTSCSSGVPGTGDNLVFDVTSLTQSKTLTNNITSLSVANITFQGTNSNFYGFTISGNALTVTGTVAVTGSLQGATINTNIALGGNVTFNAGTGSLALGGVISGTGNITTSGIVFLLGANTFTGTVTINGSTGSDLAQGLGNSANAVTVADGGNLQIGGCSGNGFTFPYSMTLTGASSSPSASFPIMKLSVGGGCSGGGGGADETYGRPSTSDQTYTLSGNITLGSDVTFGGIAKQTTLTGGLSGSHKFTLPNNYGGQLIVNSNPNTSSMANGTYNPDPIAVTLSDSQPTHTVLVGNNATVTIDGERGDTTVATGGTLMGTGKVGALSVAGTLAPGHSPGCLTSGNLDLAGGTFKAEIGGTTACTGYDQMKVTGTVTLTGGTLNASLYNNFKPAKGQTYTIIDNDGADAVVGTFSGLAEGATFNLGGNVLRVNYGGGTGNDVVLTVISVGTPDTGFALFKSNPLISMTAMTLAGGSLLVLARRSKPAARRR